MKRPGIDLKVKWPKFIPVIGIFFCLIDNSNDGNFWERGYIFYHVVACGLISMFI